MVWAIGATVAGATGEVWTPLPGVACGVAAYGHRWVIEFEQLFEHAHQYDPYSPPALMLPAISEGWIWKWGVVAEMTHLLPLVTIDDGELMRGRNVVRRDTSGRFDVDPRMREPGGRP